ncbi:MAG: hypothetical protein WAZ64_05050, partial [Candidatus Moraniibacteriota bacterium]
TLERWQALTGFEGSNPSLSAVNKVNKERSKPTIWLAEGFERRSATARVGVEQIVARKLMRDQIPLSPHQVKWFE